MRRVTSHGIGFVLFASLAAACHSSSPTTPTPPPTTSRANVTITSMSVTGERASTGGYAYRTIVHLRETAGTAATIQSVDLTFMGGSAPVMSSHYDQPLAGPTSVCPASGAVDTKELMTADADPSHPYATTVQAKVTFTDTAVTGSASASSDVPPLGELPPPITYTLNGVISDETTGRGIAGARVEILTGLNTGIVATTDASGAYTMGGLVADSFRMRASANGYDSGEQGVSVPANPRADFALRQTNSACVYTIGPATIDVPPWASVRCIA